MSLEIDCILSNLKIQEKHPINSVVSRVLRRADRVSMPVFSEVETLFWLNSAGETNLSIAALTGLGDGLDTTKHYWLRADPLLLQADLNALYIAPSYNTQIDLKPLKSVIERIQSLLQAYQIRLYTPHPNRWYLSMPFNPELKTISPIGLEGKLLYEDGLEASSLSPVPWRRLVAEIQMVLHTAQTPFNTLWLWGEGVLLNSTLRPKTAFKAILSEDPIAIGFARYLGIEVIPIPANLQQLPAGKYLLYLANLSEQSQLCYEKHCLDLLKQRKIQILQLYKGEGTVYRLTPYLIRRFWRDWWVF